MDQDIIQLDEPQMADSIIKVIGVGGGGSNAVNHMYNLGITGVNFMVCNTDEQALLNSPVPLKVQLGKQLTLGRGAGNEPGMGREAAMENLSEIESLLTSGAKMVFLTAGMGGGTGTGAVPVIAELCKKLDILTVGIVTMPFTFEGEKRNTQALKGIQLLKNQVDALLVIHNDRLRDIYGDQKLSVAFSNADDVLAAAAKGIAEIITVHGYVNVDFADVKTVMQNSGVAIMGTGVAEGEGRAYEAIRTALISPLLNSNNLRGARNILLNINSGEQEVLMDEITEIMDFIQRGTGLETDIIWGNGNDMSLGDAISVTIIATGLKSETGLGILHEEDGSGKYKLVDEENVNDSSAVPETKVIKDEVPFEVEGMEAEKSLKEEMKTEPTPSPTPTPTPPTKKKNKNKKKKGKGWIQGSLGSLFDDTE
ncbi:MAG: cell division protein FtsZ [Bacteroidales bacterium]|nr:cell division protein FtsZ [Bacteroidales bacterium]